MLFRSAEVDNPLAGDKLTAILLRYNLVDVLNIKGEHFIQLHPLLHEFAREKLTNSARKTILDQRYNVAVYDWVHCVHDEIVNGIHRSSHQIHAQDLLHVLDYWIREEEWQKVIWFFKLAFELFVFDSPSEGKAYEIISFIEARLTESGLPEVILLKVILSHRKAILGILKPDLIQRGPLLELACNLGKSIEPIKELKGLYWIERGYVLREMIEW